jgi:hypothetical protein
VHIADADDQRCAIQTFGEPALALAVGDLLKSVLA